VAVEHLNPAEDHRRTNQEDDRHNNDEDGERVRQVFTGRSSREGPKAPRRRTRQAGPNSVNAVAGGPAGGYALYGDRTVWAGGRAIPATRRTVEEKGDVDLALRRC